MIIEGIKPNALPIKHLPFFCTQENTKSTSVFCSMFLSSNYDIIVLQSFLSLTVKGVKSVVTAPTRIDSFRSLSF
jgi:hypothetical protein